MRMHWVLVPLLYGLCSMAHADPQVEVEILDHSAHVYSYEPVLVVFEIRNTGPEGVAVPAAGCGGEGAILEIGLVGQPLREPNHIYDCRPDRLVWLEPGERYLLLKGASPGGPGDYDFQAVLRSSGRCSGLPVGPHRDRIKELAENQRSGGTQYECWSGEIRSPLVSVAVQAPDTEVDLAAADFLDLDHERWKNNWKAGLISYATALYQKFPTSHYTYAALAAAGAYSKMSDVVIAQPDNPLNPWIAGAMATNLVAPAVPCARSSEQPPNSTSHLKERYQRLALAYPPPKAVQDYLHQQALEYSTEECPKKVAAEGEENAQPPE